MSPPPPHPHPADVQILYRLYLITGKDDHRDFASLFDKTVFLGHMAAHDDVLYDLHANTHLAQVRGWDGEPQPWQERQEFQGEQE